MNGPSPEELLAEAARIAFYFHWSLDAILDLEHRDRRRFVVAIEELRRELA
jgi:hypothetical protein